MCVGYVENLEWVYLKEPLTENTYDTLDYQPRDEDLYMILKEGRLGYDVPENIN